MMIDLSLNKSAFELAQFHRMRLVLYSNNYSNSFMDDFFRNFTNITDNYLVVLIILYLLALLQPRKLLLYSALLLACLCIPSFMGYPESLMGISRAFVESLRFQPSIEIFNIPDQYLPELHEAFARGFCLCLTLVIIVSMFCLPIRQLIILSKSKTSKTTTTVTSF